MLTDVSGFELTGIVGNDVMIVILDFLFAAARAPVSHPAAGPQLPHVRLHWHLH